MISADSVSIGVTDVVNRIANQIKACPDQKFSLVGYSQGARVMRGAAVKIPSSSFPSILALVMFGDRGIRDMSITQFPPQLQAKLFENCAPRDPVSNHTKLSHNENCALISDPGLQWRW
jgi:cutinase